MPDYGVSFVPGQDQQQPQHGGASPLQQALQVLSLRLPRVQGANSLAPSGLLHGMGGAMFGGDMDLERLLAQLFGPGGPLAGGGGMPPPSQPTTKVTPSGGPPDAAPGGGPLNPSLPPPSMPTWPAPTPGSIDRTTPGGGTPTLPGAGPYSPDDPNTSNIWGMRNQPRSPFQQNWLGGGSNKAY